MWIDKDIIPALIDAVEKTIKSELEAFDDEDFNEDEHFDGNDLVILDSFVLHTLRENIGRGFYSSEMLYKGFGFMMGMVDGYLKFDGHTLPDICFNKLARLHYEYYLKEAISYMDCIGIDNIKENANSIDAYIERAMLQCKFSQERSQPIQAGTNHDVADNNVVPLRLVSDNEGLVE